MIRTYLKFGFFFVQVLALNTSYSKSDNLQTLIEELESVNQINCKEMDDEEIAQQCTREICGPPGNKSSDISVKNLNKHLNPEQIKEMNKLEVEATKAFNLRKKEKIELIKELEKRVQNPQFSNTKDWDEYDYSMVSYMFWKYVAADHDINKPLAQRYKVNIDEASVPPYLLEAVKEFTQNYTRQLKADPVMAFNYGALTEAELKVELLNKSKSLEKKIKKDSIAKLISELNSKTTSDDLLKTYANIESLATDSNIQLTENINYCGEKCRKGLTEHTKRIDYKSIIKIIKYDIENEKLEDSIANCKAAFASANIQNKKTQNFNKIWPTVKKSYKDNVLPKFSKHSQGLMSDYLDNGIHFYFNNPNHYKSPQIDLNPKTSDIPIIEKSNAFLLNDLEENFYNKDFDDYAGKIEICSPYSQVNNLWDSYYAKEKISPEYAENFYDMKKDNIAVSPFSCEHIEEGQGVVAHELGHAFSYLMNREGMSENSLADYRKMRTCATNQWDTKDKAESSDHPNDSVFTEEDMADITSFLALKDSKTIVACGFMGVKDDNSSYINLETTPWGKHSPSTIRLVRELLYKRPNKIPSYCLEIIKRNQDKIGDNKCF